MCTVDAMTVKGFRTMWRYQASGKVCRTFTRNVSRRFQTRRLGWLTELFEEVDKYLPPINLLLAELSRRTRFRVGNREGKRKIS